MKDFILNSQNLPDSFRVWIFFISLLLFSFIEFFAGLKINKFYFKHFWLNFKFAFYVAPVQFVFGIVLVYVFKYCNDAHFGIFNLLVIDDFWLYCVLVFLYLDFCEYLYHVVMHRFKKLWMFHAVHHSDHNVNTSTVLREHPGETFIRLTCLSVFVLFGGMTVGVFIFRQIIQVFYTVFVHSAFRFSPTWDKIISSVFITPNMHQVHHHEKEHWTDTNYGDIFSIWDHLFRTFQRVDDPNLIVHGLDVFPDSNEVMHMGSLLKIPFTKYRSKEDLIQNIDASNIERS